MSHYQVVALSLTLALLIILAAFFSCAETALMAINRYRLRHKARMRKPSAVLILKLLKRPDRLLGMILIGNNLSNIVASAIATVLAIHFWGDHAVILSTAALTLIILVFAEVAPKTVAALYPERTSKIVAWPVSILLKIFYPIVWFINAISNGILRLLGVKIAGYHADTLSRDELRSVVYETASRISHPYQNMLLGILDLNKVEIDEVMIPRHEIVGVDLDKTWPEIQKQLASTQFDWLPVYRENINNVIGILHMRDLAHFVVDNKGIDKDTILRHMTEAYFVPEATALNVQLLNFQQQRKRLALVVDEYGEVQGLITLADILEEIIGEYTTSMGTSNKVQLDADGSCVVDGAITIRELNRNTKWDLPTDGPRTLNGLIIEYLETIPNANICIRIAGYPIEILQVQENRVKLARVFPKISTVNE